MTAAHVSRARRTNMKILRPTRVKRAPITPILLLQAMPSQTASVMRGIRVQMEAPVWSVPVELTRHLRGQMLAPLVTITQYPQPEVHLQMLAYVRQDTTNLVAIVCTVTLDSIKTQSAMPLLARNACLALPSR